MKIGFIGTGNMATSLASKWQKHHSLAFSGTTSAKATAIAKQFGGQHFSAEELVKESDAVVIATPASKVLEVIEDIGGRDIFAGKVVVDINNPVDVDDFLTTVPVGTSLTELITQMLPCSSVIKAFNMSSGTTWRNEDMSYGGSPLQVMFTADDPRGIAMARRLIIDTGAEPFFIGDNRHAYKLEAAATIVIQQLFGESPAESNLQWIERR